MNFAKQVSEDKFEIQNGAGALTVFAAFPEARETKISETLIEEIMTPQRPNDKRRIKLKTFMIENAAREKNTYFLNVFQPKDALETEPSDVTVRRLKGKNCIGVEITSADMTETFLFSERNEIDFEGTKSRSKWISVVRDKNGQIVKTIEYKAK